jgi:hypothetical protein
MRTFRDLLEENDQDAAIWRSPIAEETQEKYMAFERTIEYQTVNRNAMLPFARVRIEAGEEDEEEFLKDKDELLKAWREERLIKAPAHGRG